MQVGLPYADRHAIRQPTDMGLRLAESDRTEPDLVEPVSWYPLTDLYNPAGFWAFIKL